MKPRVIKSDYTSIVVIVIRAKSYVTVKENLVDIM